MQLYVAQGYAARKQRQQVDFAVEAAQSQQRVGVGRERGGNGVGKTAQRAAGEPQRVHVEGKVREGMPECQLDALGAQVGVEVFRGVALHQRRQFRRRENPYHERNDHEHHCHDDGSADSQPLQHSHPPRAALAPGFRGFSGCGNRIFLRHSACIFFSHNE